MSDIKHPKEVDKLYYDEEISIYETMGYLGKIN